MARWALAAFALVAFNVALVQLREERREVSRALSDRDAGRDQRRERALAGSRERSELADLIARSPEPFATSGGVGPLRHALIASEAGLAINRLSLEFRPDDAAPERLTGARVQATLHGPFHAIYRYLAAVEARGLPLSPDQLVLRGDRDGDELTVSVRWTARWADETTHALPSLTPAETAALSGWLAAPQHSVSSRDPFRLASERAVVEAPSTSNMAPAATPPDLTASEAVTASSEALPVLTGFILARPELEEDVDRRVLAAMTFGGELHLVQIGDSVGNYVVERIAPRESVTLASASDGARVVLTLP